MVEREHISPENVNRLRDIEANLGPLPTIIRYFDISRIRTRAFETLSVAVQSF